MKADDRSLLRVKLVWTCVLPVALVACAGAEEDETGYGSSVASTTSLRQYEPSPASGQADDHSTATEGVTLQSIGTSINSLSLLLRVLRESIADDDEDKQYYLQKLAEYNHLCDALAAQSQALSAASNQARRDQPRSARTSQKSAIAPRGMLSENASAVNRNSLASSIAEIERLQEDVRNQRQNAQAAFQAADQRVNQLYQILAGIIKTMNEQRSVAIRNLL